MIDIKYTIINGKIQVTPSPIELIHSGKMHPIDMIDDTSKFIRYEGLGKYKRTEIGKPEGISWHYFNIKIRKQENRLQKYYAIYDKENDVVKYFGDNIEKCNKILQSLINARETCV